MNILKRDEKLEKIIKYIAHNPGSSLYGIGQKSGVNRITVVRKIKDQYKLEDLGVLKVEKGDRGAEQCWFTYKGLLFAIKLNAIKPREAHDIRVKHNIRLPELPKLGLPKSILMGLKALVSDMEKNFPRYFYWNITAGRKLLEDKRRDDAFLRLMTIGMGLTAFSILYEYYPERVKRFIKGKDLVLSNGTVVEDFENLTNFFRDTIVRVYIMRPKEQKE